ncbi:MAG: ogt [Herbinix sp.]|jgi:methylated-DNA-[protein]-cysteine S-methyltransferase|nr:ogt [Herbinix sp.]
MEFAYIYETKLGKIVFKEKDESITEVSISVDETGNEGDVQSNLLFRETDLIKAAAIQLCEYLDGKRQNFTIPLKPEGTEFQKKVWNALISIPYGEVRTYKQIAEQVGNEKASRAVGMANHNNPIMCLIPCHRVIGANGSLVGYAGGLHRKEFLLNLEKANSQVG